MEKLFSPAPWAKLKVEDYYQIKGQPPFLRGFTDHIANVEGEANAALIAAAPDLLEALEAVGECLGVDYNLPPWVKDQVEAAINKATTIKQ